MPSLGAIKKSPVPAKPGFYWARWCIAAEGTADNGEGCGGANAEWEIVSVFVNGTDTDDPEYLMAEVPGVAKGQALENFFWGPGPLDLARAYYTPSTELQFRYDVRAALGWNDKTSLDILLDGVRRLKQSNGDLLASLEAINRRASPNGGRVMDALIRDLDWVTDEARAAIAKAEGA
jgi:hypothetical protein